MKAAQISQYGDIDVLKVTTEASKPTPKEGQVLIEVHASSINPFDWKVRKGFMQQMKQLEFPVTLGGDISGVITELGAGVTSFSVGDKVYGQANIFGGGSGAFAEFAVTSSSQIAKMPEGVDFPEAGAIPLTGVSALQVIEDHMKLHSGQKILIHGGAGGIGSVAIQIAKHLGAYVITTASAKAAEYVRNLGADEVIDYHTEHFDEILHDIDAVFDTVGEETYEKSFKVLKVGGIIVSMVAGPNEELAKQFAVTAIVQSTKVTTESLERLGQLVITGGIKIKIDTRFPLEQIQDAFRAQEEGSPQGKIVVVIKGTT